MIEKILPDRTDLLLIRKATEHLLLRRRQRFHSVAAAVLTGAGTIHVAIDVRSRKSPVCAEPCAVSASHSAGDYDIVRVAAVLLAGDREGGTAVLSPCGACRELLHYHAPDCQVLVQEGDEVWRVRIAQLFTFPTVPERSYSASDEV